MCIVTPGISLIVIEITISVDLDKTRLIAMSDPLASEVGELERETPSVTHSNLGSKSFIGVFV